MQLYVLNYGAQFQLVFLGFVPSTQLMLQYNLHDAVVHKGLSFFFHVD